MPPSRQRTCQLAVPARPASVDAILDLVQSLWTEPADFPAKDQTRFETALIEVAGNIVRHAAGTSASRDTTIELTLTVAPGYAAASFRDNGGAADLDLANVTMPDPTEESGRGLPLTRALADVLTYDRVGSTNIWTLICRRTNAPPP